MRPGDTVLLSIPLGWDASDSEVKKIRKRLSDEFPEVNFVIFGSSKAHAVSTVFVYRPE